jgi:hypothetical protein
VQAEAVTHTAFGNGTPAATCKLHMVLPIFHKCIRADGLLLELLLPDTPPVAFITGCQPWYMIYNMYSARKGSVLCVNFKCLVATLAACQ